MQSSEGVPAYLLEKQCSRQWREFLRAMAGEFAAQLSADDLRKLMHRIGVRFATASALPTCHSLQDIQTAANRVWDECDWGVVDMQEVAGVLRLIHRFAPWRAAFGDAALAWTPAFLEGVYQQWFLASGAGEGLSVRQASESSADGTVEYRLGL